MLRFLLCFFAFTHTAHAEVTVFSAVSMKGVLDELSQSAPMPVTSSYAGSASLARQISQGAPADVFISASPDWADWVRQSLGLGPEAARAIAGNELVVIRPVSDAAFDIADLPTALGDDRLALGHVRAVPAGSYAKEALTSLGLWEQLSGKIVQTEHVRAALRLVALGEAPFGVTYATDAVSEPRVEVVYRFDASTHQPILYHALALNDTPETWAFLDFLKGPVAAQVFAKHGFVPVAAE